MPDQIAEWELEPELASPIPRRVVLKETFVVKACVTFILLLAFPLLLTIVAIVAAESEGGAAWVILLASTSVFLAGYIVCSFEQERRFSKLLVRRGLPARGIIVHKEWSTTDGDGIAFAIAYDKPAGQPAGPSYLDGAGVDFSGVTNNRPARNYLSVNRSRILPGETETILYLPEASERAKPYKDCAYRAVQRQEQRGQTEGTGTNRETGTGKLGGKLGTDGTFPLFAAMRHRLFT